jgi:hypothetical protein
MPQNFGGASIPPRNYPCGNISQGFRICISPSVVGLAKVMVGKALYVYPEDVEKVDLNIGGDALDVMILKIAYHVSLYVSSFIETKFSDDFFFWGWYLGLNSGPSPVATPLALFS